MNNTLKDGYYARPVRIEDLETMVKMLNETMCAQIGVETESVEQVRVQWQASTLNIAEDTMAVFTQDDQPVAYIELWDNGYPHVRLFGWSAVHPKHWEQGIGQFLLDWLVARAHKTMALAPEGARVVLQLPIESSNQAAKDLMARNGFQHIRDSNMMRIDFDGAPPAPQLPDGIIIRPIQNEEEEREAIRASQDAFKDHWGHVDEPFEEMYKRHKQYIDNDPRHDPSLWFIALEGDKIAGVSLCYPYQDENPEQGWVNTLGVRRDWRKHGLGLALLRHSFVEFYKRGKSSVGLGVDASSLTGALRLYERAGMYVKRTTHVYEQELRPGQELMTLSIETD